MMDDDEDMRWFGSEYRSLSGITVGEVVKGWSEEQGELLFDLELCREVPEIIWAALLEILLREITTDQEAVLAAGPLENLLSFHGNAFIDRVEQQARGSAHFNHLLGGVWQNGMTPDVWKRVQTARNEV